MRPHFSERLAELRADLTQNPASEEEINLMERVYLDAVRAHLESLCNQRLARMHAVQSEALAAAEAVWQSQTALLAEQRRAAEAARAAAAQAAAQALAAQALAAPIAPVVPVEVAPVTPAAPVAPVAPDVSAAPATPVAPSAPSAPAPVAETNSEDDKLWAYAKAAAQAAKNVLAGFPDGPPHEEIAAAPVSLEPVAVEPVAVAPAAAPAPPMEPVAAAPAAPVTPPAPAEAAPKATPTVADKAASGATKGRSLNARFANFSLGLNDRLAFSKHLFNDNPEDLARVVNQLNTYETYEESLAFIEQMVKPEYDWSAKQDYEERFLNLIKLRFE